MSNKVSDNTYDLQAPRQGFNPWRDRDPTVHRKGNFRRLRQFNAKKLRLLLARRRERLQKWRTAHPTAEKHPVFIMGSNRSGTQMVCETIGNSPHGWDYQESEANLAFKDFQLRADWLIKYVIRFAPAPVISFGNILDSQFADELLSRFEGAKAIWVYRRFEDAANSSVRKWGSHLKDDIIRWVARGELHRLDARGERISSETVQLIEKLYHEDITDEDGACLYWYMRNQLYFDLNLHQDPRVLLVQYEDTVLNPERAFQRVFDFLDFPYDPAITQNIFASSVGKDAWSGIDSDIQAVCNTLKATLDKHYAETSTWTQTEVASQITTPEA